MQRLPKVVYSPEFREQAIRLLLKGKLTVAEIPRRLSMPKGTLKNWVSADRQGTIGELGKGQKPLTLSELELELAKLKRELAEVKMEREMLKKCTAYFVRTSA